MQIAVSLIGLTLMTLLATYRAWSKACDKAPRRQQLPAGLMLKLQSAIRDSHTDVAARPEEATNDTAA